jgi:hypothetical protein
MFEQTALASILGADELQNCSSHVRTLAGDPEALTAYRLFWPLHQIGFDPASNSLDCSDQRLNEPAFLHLQCRFINSWLRFSLGGEPLEAATALTSFAELYEAEDADYAFARTLVNERTSEDEAMDLVYQAQEKVIAHMLDVTCGRTISAWDRGEADRALSLVQAICASTLPKDYVDKSLVRLVPAGEREAASIRQLIEEDEWEVGDPLYNGEDIRKLKGLAEAVYGRLPSASTWEDVVQRRIVQMGYCMRNAAVDLANDNNDYAQAEAILKYVASLPLPSDMDAKVRSDLAELRRVAKEHADFAGVSPVEAAPALGTRNGVGFMLLGGSPFPGRAGWYYKTQYFVFFFIPVLPLGRFIVSDAPSGGWYFHGSAPLTKWHKYHIAAVLALVIGGFALSQFPITSSSATADATYGSGGMAYVPPSSPYGSGSSSSHSASGSSDDPSRDGIADDKSAAEERAREAKRLARAKARAEEARRLAREHDRLKGEIEFDEQVLERVRADLQEKMGSLDEDRPLLDTTDEAAVDAFNERVEEANALKDQFNKAIQVHNRRVNRLNDLAAKLQKLGN